GTCTKNVASPRWDDDDHKICGSLLTSTRSIMASSGLDLARKNSSHAADLIYRSRGPSYAKLRYNEEAGTYETRERRGGSMLFAKSSGRGLHVSSRKLAMETNTTRDRRNLRQTGNIDTVAIEPLPPEGEAESAVHDLRGESLGEEGENAAASPSANNDQAIQIEGEETANSSTSNRKKEPSRVNSLRVLLLVAICAGVLFNVLNECRRKLTRWKHSFYDQPAYVRAAFVEADEARLQALQVLGLDFAWLAASAGRDGARLQHEVPVWVNETETDVRRGISAGTGTQHVAPEGRSAFAHDLSIFLNDSQKAVDDADAETPFNETQHAKPAAGVVARDPIENNRDADRDRAAHRRSRDRRNREATTLEMNDTREGGPRRVEKRSDTTTAVKDVHLHSHKDHEYYNQQHKNKTSNGSASAMKRNGTISPIELELLAASPSDSDPLPSKTTGDDEDLELRAREQGGAELWRLLFEVLYAVLAAMFCIPVQAAAGGGIPEVKCMLTGVLLPDYVSRSVLVCKSVGLVLILACGIPSGQEGPFVHICICLLSILYQGKMQVNTQTVLALVAVGVG
ncbi:unnamed protein product, partial [Amoebophrya sp. A120]